jgi:hypothetical protein
MECKRASLPKITRSLWWRFIPPNVAKPLEDLDLKV